MGPRKLSKPKGIHILKTIVGKYKIINVEGESMNPILEAGDWIIVDPNFQSDEIEKGMICIANHPFITGKKVVKYIHDIDQEGRVYLLGSNLSTSTDSRSYGWINKNKIFAIVQSKI